MPSPARSLGTKLKVHIHSASNLPRGDERGLSDPYVVCFLGEDVPAFQTKVCRQTLDPVWDEEHVVKPYVPGLDMVLQILDQDDTFKDLTERLLAGRGVGSDFLGEVRLASDEFYPHGFEGDLLLEGVPEGRNALLRLSIIVDEGQHKEYMMPPSVAPQLPLASKHEPGVVDETYFDTAEFEAMENLPKEESTPKIRGSGKTGKKSEPAKAKLETEQRGGSSPSRTRPSRPAGVAVEVQQLTVTVLGAKDLQNGRCSYYCTCEVKGDLRFSGRSHVVNDVIDPVWQKTMEFDYEGIEPLVFCVFQKEVWPKQDTLLGMATLEAEDITTSFEQDLPLEGAEEGACLTVKVILQNKRRVARQEHPHQRYLEEPAKRREPISNATKTAVHPAEMKTRRLKVLIQSFRGLHGLDLQTRRCFSCICAIAGHRHAELQTNGAFEAGYQTVWNLEGEIYDYFPGDDLEFHIAAEGSTLEGSATLRCHQFFPFGFNSELTMSSEGQGIIGLLRVKVTVEKEEVQKPIRGTGLRMLGMPGQDVAHFSQQQGERWLKSLHPMGAMHSSLAVAAGTERHRLGESSGSVVRRKVAPGGLQPTQVAHQNLPAELETRPSSPQAVPTTLAPSRSTSPIVRVTYAPVASQVIHGTLPPTPHFAPATAATPTISAIHLPIQTRQMPVTMTCPAPVHYNRCPVNTFGQMQSQAPHLGQQPVSSSLPNGAGVSAGALSLLAEAQASWRAGECGATIF